MERERKAHARVEALVRVRVLARRLCVFARALAWCSARKFRSRISNKLGPFASGTIKISHVTHAKKHYTIHAHAHAHVALPHDRVIATPGIVAPSIEFVARASPSRGPRACRARRRRGMVASGQTANRRAEACAAQVPPPLPPPPPQRRRLRRARRSARATRARRRPRPPRRAPRRAAAGLASAACAPRAARAGDRRRAGGPARGATRPTPLVAGGHLQRRPPARQRRVPSSRSPPRPSTRTTDSSALERACVPAPRSEPRVACPPRPHPPAKPRQRPSVAARAAPPARPLA